MRFECPILFTAYVLPQIQSILQRHSNICTKTLKSRSERTYGAAGFNIFPPLLGLATSHRCFRIPFRCKSRLIFMVSFFPIIVFKKFFARFISKCITSRVQQTSRCCHTHRPIRCYCAINTISSTMNPGEQKHKGEANSFHPSTLSSKYYYLLKLMKSFFSHKYGANDCTCL
jgi:hypothetical protein